MLKYGEKVVTAVVFRDSVIVIGDQGTVLEIFYNYSSSYLQVRHSMDLEGAKS